LKIFLDADERYIYLFLSSSIFLKEAKFIPLTDPPVYNSYNLLIFLNIIIHTNETGKKFIAIFHKNYVNYYIKLCKLLHKIM